MQVQILQKNDAYSLRSSESAKTTIRERERKRICLYVYVYWEGGRGRRKRSMLTTMNLVDVFQEFTVAFLKLFCKFDFFNEKTEDSQRKIRKHIQRLVFLWGQTCLGQSGWGYTPLWNLRHEAQRWKELSQLISHTVTPTLNAQPTSFKLEESQPIVWSIILFQIKHHYL